MREIGESLVQFSSAFDDLRTDLKRILGRFQASGILFTDHKETSKETPKDKSTPTSAVEQPYQIITRSGSQPASKKEAEEEWKRKSNYDLGIHQGKRLCFSKKRQLKPTPLEFDILTFLLRQKDAYIYFGTIYNQVWRNCSTYAPHATDFEKMNKAKTKICRVRKMLEGYVPGASIDNEMSKYALLGKFDFLLILERSNGLEK